MRDGLRCVEFTLCRVCFACVGFIPGALHFYTSQKLHKQQVVKGLFVVMSALTPRSVVAAVELHFQDIAKNIETKHLHML